MNSAMPIFPYRAAAVTKSDATVFGPSAVYVGTTGDVTVMPAAGTATVLFPSVPAGAMVPVMCIQVMSTGTTASGMVRVFE